MLFDIDNIHSYIVGLVGHGFTPLRQLEYFPETSSLCKVEVVVSEVNIACVCEDSVIAD
jgi:hypothetical protein